MIVGYNMFYTFTFFDITLEERKNLIETADNYDINYSYNELTNILIVYDVPVNIRNEFINYANLNNIEYKQEIKEQSGNGDINNTVLKILENQVNFDYRLLSVLFNIHSFGGEGTVGGNTGNYYYTIYGALTVVQVQEFARLAQELGVPITISGEGERQYLTAGPLTSEQKTLFQKLGVKLNVGSNTNPGGEIPPIINPGEDIRYTRQQFISIIADYCVYKMHETGILASLAIAQCTVESGNGNSGLTAVSNNLFGYKGKYNGESVLYPTKEWVNGQYIEVMGEFRKYPNWNASIDDYFSLLSGAYRYQNLIGERDYKTACYKVQQDGYATAPTYATTLISVIEANNLQKYDEM